MGLLVQSCCGEGGALQTNVTGVCVGSTRSVWPHWVCARSRRTCLPRLHCSGSRLLYRERALSCVHFPGLSHSDSGSRVLHKGANSVGPVFCAFPVRAAQAARSLMSALSSGAARLLPSPSQTRFLTDLTLSFTILTAIGLVEQWNGLSCVSIVDL